MDEIERLLASPALSDATRRAYRTDLEQFAAWLRGRRLAARGRRRPRAHRLRRRARTRPAEARPGDDRPQALGRARAAPLRARPVARPRRVARPAPPAPAARPRRSRPRSTRCSRRSTATARSASATARSSSSSTPPACAAPRRSASTSRTSTSSRSSSTCAGRAARSGRCRSARRPPTGSPLYLREGRPAARAGRRERRLPLGARAPARHEHAPAADPEPAPAPARVRDAPARGRRRPARDPGAARPQLALDDADLQPRRRPPAAARLRSRASALVEPPSLASAVFVTLFLFANAVTILFADRRRRHVPRQRSRRSPRTSSTPAASRTAPCRCRRAASSPSSRAWMRAARTRPSSSAFDRRRRARGPQRPAAIVTDDAPAVARDLAALCSGRRRSLVIGRADCGMLTFADRRTSSQQLGTDIPLHAFDDLRCHGSPQSAPSSSASRRSAPTR